MEQTILTNLLTTSPIAAVLFYALVKVWNEYKSEKNYNRERDKEDLKLYTDLNHLATNINSRLSETNIDLTKIKEHLAEIQNYMDRMSERQIENGNTIKKNQDTLAEMKNELKFSNDKSNRV